MSAQDNATARPWSVDRMEHSLAIQAPDKRMVAFIGAPSREFSECEANAALIVRAVNSHDDLVWAAKNAALTIAAILDRAGQDRTSSPTLMQLTAAIKKAEGRQL
jgi:hypothetical protein